jgi:hypothetical protein
VECGIAKWLACQPAVRFGSQFNVLILEQAQFLEKMHVKAMQITESSSEKILNFHRGLAPKLLNAFDINKIFKNGRWGAQIEEHRSVSTEF